MRLTAAVTGLSEQRERRSGVLRSYATCDNATRCAYYLNSTALAERKNARNIAEKAE